MRVMASSFAPSARLCICTHSLLTLYTEPAGSLWPACFERDPESNKLLHQDEEWLQPTCHMFYGTRVRDVSDDLPRWDGFEGKSERL